LGSNVFRRDARTVIRKCAGRLIVMFNKRRLGRLQRQCHYAFIAHEGHEVSGPELRSWCFPQAVWIEQRQIGEYERQSMCEPRGRSAPIGFGVKRAAGCGG
jgi:hypothetical protein